MCNRIFDTSSLEKILIFTTYYKTYAYTTHSSPHSGIHATAVNNYWTGQVAREGNLTAGDTTACSKVGRSHRGSGGGRRASHDDLWDGARALHVVHCVIILCPSGVAFTPPILIHCRTQNIATSVVGRRR